MKRHLQILDFALICLWRHKRRHALVMLVYGLVVFILSSVLMFIEALKHEAALLLEHSPALTVQRLSAGRHAWIPLAYSDRIQAIRGVCRVSPRLWGYYYDPPPDATYTLMGVDALPWPGTQLVQGQGLAPGSPEACVIGLGVAEARLLDLNEILPVKASDGQLCVLRVTDLLTARSALLTQDLVLVSTETWRRIFGVPGDVATDLVVEVPNGKEVDTVARKIREALPDVRLIQREDILRTYDAVFDWRGSLVLLALGGALAAFAILACDQVVSLGTEERSRLAVLKAIGWSMPDVLTLKLWEALSISLLAFLTGTVAAHWHVFYFGGGLLAGLLKGWSTLFPVFQLQPHGEPFQILIVFMLTVIPYLLVTLVPAWTAATVDPHRMMRG